MDMLETWLHSRGMNEIECLVPDISGIPHGKIPPTSRFLASKRERGLRLLESVFVQTLTGNCPEEDPSNDVNIDIYLGRSRDCACSTVVQDEPTA